MIYGNNEDELRPLRDYNNNGKMKLEYLSTPDGQFGYPPVNSDGDLITGITAKTKNLFTDMFATILLREHNRLCNEFFAEHGNDWDDEKYFQEARKWVIAFIQKITYFEYRKFNIYVVFVDYIEVHYLDLFIYDSWNGTGNSFTSIYSI